MGPSRKLIIPKFALQGGQRSDRNDKREVYYIFYISQNNVQKFVKLELGLDISSFSSHSFLDDFPNIVTRLFEVVSESLYVVVGSTVHRSDNEAKCSVVDRVRETVTFIDDWRERTKEKRDQLSFRTLQNGVAYLLRNPNHQSIHSRVERSREPSCSIERKSNPCKSQEVLHLP